MISSAHQKQLDHLLIQLANCITSSTHPNPIIYGILITDSSSNKMLVKTYAGALIGIEANLITIEVSAGGAVFEGKPGYALVGLPDNAVREGYHRIGAAIKNLGLRLPRIKIVINMAPADLKKEGSYYDLPIAIGMLSATGQIKTEILSKYLIMGELSLDGSIKPIKGALSISIMARDEGFEGIILPKENAKEAAMVDNIHVFGVSSLSELIGFITEDIILQPEPPNYEIYPSEEKSLFQLDFSDVKGQENIKRALEISAAGGHNVILIGPPGAGKTMLAKRFPTILPPLSLEEALETTKIHSVAGTLPGNQSLVRKRPFRSPHHTISDVALVGGGSNPQPGEISLAHNGVLFLDELPEFKRTVLEVLRQPLEERKVTISRAKVCVDYPSNFVLIGSSNPCPCGYFTHPSRECSCPPGAVKKYLNKISGPLLDRIDLHVEVTPIEHEELSSKEEGESSGVIVKRVIAARAIQSERFQNLKGVHCNAQMNSRMVREICLVGSSGQALLKTAMKKLQLSARAYDRILKVARTIADLSGVEQIDTSHLSEAIQFRSLDRGDIWG